MAMVLENSNSTHPKYLCSKHLDVAFLCAYIVLGIAIFFGNTLCTVVFLSTPQLRSCHMNVFLVSLSVAEILSSLFVIPGYCAFCTSCSKDYFLDVLGRKHCRILDAVKDFVWLSSIFSLIGITYDRYIAVIHPLRYRWKITNRKVVEILLAVWLLPIPVAFIKPIINATEVSFLSENSYSEGVYDISVVLCFVIFPVVILFVVNVMITRAIRRQLQKVNIERRENEVSTRRENRHKTITCLIIVLFFLVCWLPRCLLNCLNLMKFQDKRMLKLLGKISLLFIFLQSMANPFFYSFYRRDFRQAAKRLLPRQKSNFAFANKRQNGNTFRVAWNRYLN